MGTNKIIKVGDFFICKQENIKDVNQMGGTGGMQRIPKQKQKHLKQAHKTSSH